MRAPLPANANANPNVSINWLSCASAGNCAAVGRYIDNSGAQQGLLLTEFHGSWSAAEAHLPAGVSGNPFASVTSVSCRSALSCSAVGGYRDGSSKGQGLLLDASPVRPSLTVSAPASGAVGTHMAPSAVAAKLAGGSAPIGRLTFRVIGPKSTAPTSCTSGGTILGTVKVTGNKTYHPTAAFTPHKPGNYWWFASYGGDASDTAAASKCGTGMARSVVHR